MGSIEKVGREKGTKKGGGGGSIEEVGRKRRDKEGRGGGSFDKLGSRGGGGGVVQGRVGMGSIDKDGAGERVGARCPRQRRGAGRGGFF